MGFVSFENNFIEQREGVRCMSQFSVSFHLKTDNPQEVVDLLKGCGLKGYVFPSVNNWTMFVCEEENLERNQKVTLKPFWLT